MSAEVYASLDSMEGIELPQPIASRPPVRKTPPWRSKGLLAAVGVAAAAFGIHYLVPALSSAILAIVLGAIIRNTIPLPAALIDDCKGLVKRVIPLTIILTGASVNLAEVARVGAPALAVIVASIVCGCLAAVLAGRMVKTSRHTAMLVGCGTAICGTSAIIAAAPVIGADDDDLLLSVSTINIMGLLVMFSLPALGAMLHATPLEFGVWAGVTVHAVPQAITTGFAYSAQSGTLATLVKLARVTLLAPFLIALVLLTPKHGRVRMGYASLLPRFIWGFLALAALNTLHLLPVLHFQPAMFAGNWQVSLSAALSEMGSLLLTLSMAAMGLEVHLRYLLRTGLAALLAGALASIAQILLSLALIHWLL
ncbi:MAG TPA: putative sulfate exporter family transporter [Bryobacteraceae bacterium]|nr:putative sulfate exporter family transporter [Bryobacteraceae bacterium]